MKRYPDEVSSWEYLNEHLLERACQGAFDKEFEACKVQMPVLAEFKNIKELIASADEDLILKLRVVADGRDLWRANHDLHPALGVVILLVLWHDLPMANLEDCYYRLFTEVLEELPLEPSNMTQDEFLAGGDAS